MHSILSIIFFLVLYLYMYSSPFFSPSVSPLYWLMVIVIIYFETHVYSSPSMFLRLDLCTF